MNWLKIRQKPTELEEKFKSKYPIIVQYSAPMWINSAEAWLLFNCRVDPVDVTSLFYQWINNKLIYINYDKKNSESKNIKSVTLVKMNNMPETYPFYERELFNGIFNSKNSRLIDENTNLSKILSLENLEDYWLKKHWLCRKNNSTWGFICFLGYVLLLGISFYFLKWFWLLIWIFLAPILCGFAFKQDNKIKLTEEWSQLAAHVIWYAKFIKECDENVLKTFLKEDPLFVDKTLPYAVAFGLETEFLKKTTPLVKDLEKSWLTWDLIPVWNIISFVKSDYLFKQNNWYLFNPFFFLSGWESSELSYSSSKWFSKWSSFSFWWFSSKWWWGWGGWKSR